MSSHDEKLTVRNEGQTETREENSTGNSFQGLHNPVKPDYTFSLKSNYAINTNSF